MYFFIYNSVQPAVVSCCFLGATNPTGSAETIEGARSSEDISPSLICKFDEQLTFSEQLKCTLIAPVPCSIF